MITETLQKIQTELKAPKDKRNSFGNYNFRSAESILESVKPILAKHGVSLTLSDDIVLIGDRYYVCATATLYEGEENKSVTAYARECAEKKGMDEAQITGSASSYARKYALNGLFAIDDTKDPDTEEYANVSKNAPATKPKEEKPKAKTEPDKKKDELRDSALKVVTASGKTFQELVGGKSKDACITLLEVIMSDENESHTVQAAAKVLRDSIR